MRSQRLQPQALATLLSLLQQQNLAAATMEGARKLLEEGKPTMEELSALVSRLFEEVPSTIAAEMEQLRRVPLLDGGEEIEDVESFRAGLSRGEGVKPAADFATDLEAHL